MLPEFYQSCFQAQLSPTQYLMLQMLVLLLQKVTWQKKKALLCPVLGLLKDYQIILIADREFHSVKLAEIWSTLAPQLMRLKPQKLNDFKRGLRAMKFIQSSL